MQPVRKPTEKLFKVSETKIVDGRSVSGQIAFRWADPQLYGCSTIIPGKGCKIKGALQDCKNMFHYKLLFRITGHFRTGQVKKCDPIPISTPKVEFNGFSPVLFFSFDTKF